MEIEVVVADFQDPKHARDLVVLMDCYAKDPMGGASPLSDEARANLAHQLSGMPHAFSVICYVDGQAAGLINCFEAFSTFKCKPLVNIHDVVVAHDFRGLGISQLMLTRIENIARDKGCCRLTMEVLAGNEVAQRAYEKFGFAGYELDPQMGKALFWQKALDDT